MSSQLARLSRSEWSVMNQCWTLGQATAREVHDTVGAERGWDYNTTKTLLDRVAAKGYLEIAKVGPISVFRPVVERATARGAELEDFVRTVLDNSVAPLLVHLADTKRLSREDLDRLRELVDASDDGGDA